MADAEVRAPRVFLSYSQDSEEHSAAMLALSDRLRRDGVNCVIDQYETSPPEGWHRWMLRQIRDAYFVLCVCTPAYNRRVLGEEATGYGLGATWEGGAILAELYKAGATNTKFFPVLVDPAHTVDIPPLEAATRYRPIDEAGYEALYRRLTNQPAIEKPVLGARVSLPARERRPDYRYPSKIPVRLTPLIGRDRELAELNRLLSHDGARLVTLHGPGGVGKSRLGFEAAAARLRQLRDGAVVVDLGPVIDPNRIGLAIAEALDIREEPGIPIEDTLIRRLADREQILVIDTAEHVVEQAATLVARVLGVCPGIQILVTSREMLRVRGEHQFAVGPLELPPVQHAPYSAENIAGTGAVTLFVDRARAVAPGFELNDANAPAVAEICRRLDGLPLAIELAAAWVETLTPSELLDRLRPRLPMLVDGPRDLPQRQQTMRDAIAWSYNLLDARQQKLFRVVSTFVGDFGTSGAEGVAQPFGMSGADVVQEIRALRRKSLLSGSHALEDRMRFRMLDTIREFALQERDAQGEKAVAEEAHAAYYEDLLVKLAEPLEGTPTRAWLDQLDAEYPNVRAALEWAALQENHRLLMRLVWVLWRFWASRGYFSEGRYWLDGAFENGGVADPLIYPDLLLGAGELARMQGDYRAAMAHLQSSARISHATGETIQEASALLGQATVHYDQGAFDDAIEDWEHARRLFEQLTGEEAELGIAKAKAGIGGVALDRKDLPRARDLLESTCETFRRPGKAGDEAALASSLGQLARLAQAENRHEDANRYISESLAILTALGDARGFGHRLLVAASIAQALGDVGTAVNNRIVARELAELLGSRQGVALAKYEQALAGFGMTNEERKALVREAIATFSGIGETHGIVEAAELFAWLIAEEHPLLSVELFGAGDALRTASRQVRFDAAQRAYQAKIDALRARLGDQFEAAWRTGQESDAEQIVNQVLRN